MFVHQSRTTVPPLTRSRTTSSLHHILGCDAWEFAPDVSTQCEKVMTFATEQNHVSNVGLALETDWQRRMGIICAKRAAAYALRGELRSFCNALLRADQLSVLGGFQKPNDT